MNQQSVFLLKSKLKTRKLRRKKKAKGKLQKGESILPVHSFKIDNISRNNVTKLHQYLKSNKQMTKSPKNMVRNHTNGSGKASKTLNNRIKPESVVSVFRLLSRNSPLSKENSSESENPNGRTSVGMKKKAGPDFMTFRNTFARKLSECAKINGITPEATTSVCRSSFEVSPPKAFKVIEPEGGKKNEGCLETAVSFYKSLYRVSHINENSNKSTVSKHVFEVLQHTDHISGQSGGRHSPSRYNIKATSPVNNVISMNSQIKENTGMSSCSNPKAFIADEKNAVNGQVSRMKQSSKMFLDSQNPSCRNQSGVVVPSCPENNSQRRNEDDNCSVVSITSDGDDDVMVIENEGISKPKETEPDEVIILEIPPKKQDIPLIDLSTPAATLGNKINDWEREIRNKMHNEINPEVKRRLMQELYDLQNPVSELNTESVQNELPLSKQFPDSASSAPVSERRTGLRPIVIDGINVAMGHGKNRHLSFRGLKICIDFFVKKGHEVRAYLPRSGINNNNNVCDSHLLAELEREGHLHCIAVKFHRHIVNYAAERGGIIVSMKDYSYLSKENQIWKNTIEKRLLMYTWVGDVLMFPQDPLGRHGPTLDSFLRFP